MADDNPEEVTLNTLHHDLEVGFADLRGEMRSGFADMKGELCSGFADTKGSLTDLKATLIAGFRSMPSREQSEEMIRLLREGNRHQEERFAHLDARIREQHLETQHVLRALAESQHALLQGVGTIQEGVRALIEGVRALQEDMRALIARIDALIKGRGNGAPSS